MSLAQLLSDYGYWAVFGGTMLEGETILVLAGFAVHQGYLSMPTTLAIAFAGGTLGDQLFFWLGRRWGQTLLDRLPNSAPRVRRMNDLLVRHRAPVIIGVRFMYGLRVVGPIVIGASDVPPWRFAVLNMLGAAIWALLVGGLGYLFGHTLELLLTDIKEIEVAALCLILVVGALLAILHLWRSWSHDRS